MILLSIKNQNWTQSSLVKQEINWKFVYGFFPYVKVSFQVDIKIFRYIIRIAFSNTWSASDKTQLTWLSELLPPETRIFGPLEKNLIFIKKIKHGIHLVIERDYFALTYSKNRTFLKCGRWVWLAGSFPTYEIGHFMPNSVCIDYV